MLNGSNFSPDVEKIVARTRELIIAESLRRDKNLIIDNVNADKRHWEGTIKLAKEANKDIMVMEKIFFLPLHELIARDAARQGKAHVGEEVIKKFWNKLGGKSFEHYQPKIEIFKKDMSLGSFQPMKQDETKQPAIIVDLDNTLAIIGNRSPYDASQSDLLDSPNARVAEIVKLLHSAGHYVIFCSGRQEKDRAPTVRFIQNCLSDMPYSLFMRADNDFRKDNIVKEEIFNQKIKNNFWVKYIFDDRKSVCQMWHSIGLNLFRVGDPDASF
jgi:predicted kinase